MCVRKYVYVHMCVRTYMYMYIFSPQSSPPWLVPVPVITGKISFSPPLPTDHVEGPHMLTVPSHSPTYLIRHPTPPSPIFRPPCSFLPLPSVPSTHPLSPLQDPLVQKIEIANQCRVNMGGKSLVVMAMLSAHYIFMTLLLVPPSPATFVSDNCLQGSSQTRHQWVWRGSRRHRIGIQI